MTTSRQINAIDATNGAAAVGDGARAVHVGAGGMYVEQQTVVIQERPRVAPNLFQVPFPRSDHFVGREDDLAQIHARLSGRERRPVGLCGLGGIGKTQLAVEYAYRHRGDYTGGIFWLTAADPWTWQAGLAEIATRLGLAVPDPDSSDAQMRLARELAAHLNGHPNSLLIFDNVETPADLNISRVQDFVFAALGCRTLFTTRRRAADLPFAWLEVGRLPEDASLALLLRHESRRLTLDPAHPDHGAARELCRRLGYLPLTLELAGAFLGRNLRVTIPAYLARIGKEGIAAVDKTHLRPEDLPTGHEPSIAATLAMQWETLADASARRALQAAALLGEAEQIPRARLALLTGLPDTAEEGYASPLEDALASLRDLSLAEELTADEVRLHPLVREFAAGQIADRAAFIEAAVASLSEALWDVERLEAEVHARGVDAVVADVRMAGVLAATCPALSKVPGTSAPGFHPLLRALDLDSHILRRWNPATEPAFFLQQWRNRCFEMGWDEPMRQAEALLEARRLPYLRERRPLKTEDPSLLRTLEGHMDGVHAVALTPDGRTAISGSGDYSLKVWDLATGACLRTLEGHTGDIRALALTPDGRTAISGSRDHTLKVWDLATGACLRTFEGHTSDIRAVALTPDGRTAVSTSWDYTLKVWDLATGACLHTLEDSRLSVTALALTPDGRAAISGSDDRTPRVWDLTTGACLRTLDGHMDGVYAVALTADGRTAISGSRDHTLKVWDLATGACLRTFEGHTSDIRAVALTPDGRAAVSAGIGSRDNSLKVWDLATGACLHTHEGHTDGVWVLALTPDGRTAVSGSDDRTLKVWDLAAGACLHTMKGHVYGVDAVALTPDGRTAISGSRDRTLKVWDLATGTCLRTLEGHRSSVWTVAVTSDGRTAISGSFDLKVWDLATGACLRTLDFFAVGAVALAPDGHMAISGSDHGTIKVRDLVTGACLRTLEGYLPSVWVLALTPDGRTAISGSAYGTIKVWDLITGACLRTLKGHTGDVSALALTPDGRTAISGSKDHTLKIWDLTTGACLRTIERQRFSVYAVALAPDGRTAVSGSDDRTLKVWDLASGTCLAAICIVAGVASCTVSGASSHIVAGDDLGGVHFLEFVRWDQ